VDQFTEAFIVMRVVNDDLDIHVCPFMWIPDMIGLWHTVLTRYVRHRTMASQLPRTIDFWVKCDRAIMTNCNSFYQFILQSGMLCYSDELVNTCTEPLFKRRVPHRKT
jgi:hypothetical protein